MVSCHSGASVVNKTDRTDKPNRRIAVIGQPNTGKSTLFNRITGARAGTGNWPGITVDLLQATFVLDGVPVEFVDLPGMYDLNGFSEDEKVVQRFLETTHVDLIMVVINATQIDRQIRTALQIKALGLPAVVMLNMADEAKRFGVTIDTVMLSDRLGMLVFSVSAKYGTGCTKAIAGLDRALDEQPHTYQIGDLKGHMEANKVTDAEIESILAGAVQMPSPTMVTFTDRLDRLLMHPVWGIPLFFLSMLGVFWAIWNIGLPSQDVAGSVTDWINTTLLQPLIKPLPAGIQDFITNGLWNGVATVASFVPLIVIFFFVMAAVEDSGYLSRAAYLMDALMSKVGLDGRAFVMQLMGFGCNVPALMATRVIRSRAMRWLSMLVIPFALCSARLAVFVFIIDATFPKNQGPFVLFALYVLSFVAAFLAAAIFSQTKQFKSTEPFVLELPPYRLPTLKQVFRRGWGEVIEFLRRATNFIILGCVGVWFLTNFPVGATGLNTWGGQLGQALQPIMAPIGINPYLTLALIFGFVAKEVVIGALATIYAMDANAVSHAINISVTPVQAFSFCIFCLIYTPCLATVATVKAESKSWWFTAFALVFSLAYAWVMSFIFYQGAMLLGFK